MWISFGKNIYLIATSPTLWYSSALPKNGRWTQYSTSWPFWQDCYGTFSNKQMVASHPWKQTADQRNEGFLSHGDTPSYIYIIIYYIIIISFIFLGGFFMKETIQPLGIPHDYGNSLTFPTGNFTKARGLLPCSNFFTSCRMKELTPWLMTCAPTFGIDNSYDYLLQGIISPQKSIKTWYLGWHGSWNTVRVTSILLGGV